MTSNEDAERAERDDRTIFISGITEKVTDLLLFELFFQAGPIERVSIPKENGKNKTFAFVTYNHECSVPYALTIFSGTKLFGRELQLKYRNSSRNVPSNRNSLDNSQSSPQMSNLLNPFASSLMGFNMMPPISSQMQFPMVTQDMLQQQLLQMATAPDFTSFANFPSSRSDSVGSHRDHDRDFVDRTRHHRREDRNNRNRPYRRSRSRSPQRGHRDRSPGHSRGQNNDRDRRRDHRNAGNGGYSRWNY